MLQGGNTKARLFTLGIDIISLFDLEVRSVINTLCGMWGIFYDVTFQPVSAFFITE